MCIRDSSISQDPPPTHPLIDLEGYEAVAIDNNVLCYLALAHLSELHTDRNRQRFIMNLLQTGLSDNQLDHHLVL